MKTSILVLFCGLLSLTLQAQVPQGFTYQAVARTTTGDLLVSKPLSVRLSILDGSATGTAQYVETQTVTTNAFGLFSLTVGGGAPTKGTLNSINWSSGVKFLGVEVAFDGTNNYQNLGATQLQSVPFALYAANGGTPGPQGTKGDKGDKGDQGTVGTTGSVGPSGATGPPGIKGDRGDKGDKGDTGNGAYTAGNGITITNNVITAKDDSPTNEIQTLSLSGQTLSLSNGGGTVTLPSSPWMVNGTSIYTGSNGFGKGAVPNFAVAVGASTVASGSFSTAMGYATTASNDQSTALGSDTFASGRISTAMGAGTTASGNYATAMSYYTIASGENSTAMGYQTIASSENSTAMGIYNKDITGALLMVGNGNTINHSNALTILKSGNTGINTSAPLVPLHVAGNQSTNANNSRYFAYGSVLTAATSSQLSIGLLVESDIVSKASIVSAQTVTTSDARIKTIFGPTNSQQDLQTLRQLAVTNYTYKDVVRLGNTPQKKVIAQQVETVYPQAVFQRTDFIPDVYTVANVQAIPAGTTPTELRLTLPVAHSLHVGETVKLIDARKGDLIEMVTRVIDPQTFVVSAKQTGLVETLFVYGRQVADFRVVDYEALSVLNISATQALLQRLERIEAENARVKVNEKNTLGLLQTVVSRLNQLEAVRNTPYYSARRAHPQMHLSKRTGIRKLYAVRHTTF